MEGEAIVQAGERIDVCQVLGPQTAAATGQTAVVGGVLVVGGEHGACRADPGRRVRRELCA